MFIFDEPIHQDVHIVQVFTLHSQIHLDLMCRMVSNLLCWGHGTYMNSSMGGDLLLCWLKQLLRRIPQLATQPLHLTVIHSEA